MSKKISTDQLNILILEDPVKDLKTIYEQLIIAGLRMNVTQVKHQAEFRKAIQQNDIQIILSDFAMPGFDAFDALQISKELCPGVPFICVSGPIGEENALELIKKGASDYVHKDKPERLPNAIQQALEDAHEKAIRLEYEKQLISSKLHYETFINASTDIIFVKDSQFRYLVANDAAARFFKKNKEEMIGKTDVELAHATTMSPCKSSDEQAIASKSAFVVHEKIGNKYCETNKFPIILPDGQKGIGGIIRDITEQRKAQEESLKLADELIDMGNRAKALIDSIPDLIFIFNQDGYFIDYNTPDEGLLFISPDVFMNKHISKVLPKKIAQITLTAIKNLFTENKAQTYQYTAPINGRTCYYDIRMVTYGENKACAIVRDITEKKISEEALRESEARIQSIFRSAPVGIGLVINRAIQKVNERFCQITGFTEEEILGKSARMLYPTEEDYLYVGEDKYQQINKYGSGTVETIWRKKDGSIINILLSSTPIDVNDINKGVTFTALDISERKKAQQALAESEKKYRDLIQNSGEGIGIVDKNECFTFINPAGASMFGLSEHEMINRSLLDFCSVESRNAIYDLTEHRSSGASDNYELEIIRPDGNARNLIVTTTPQYDSTGKFIGTFGIFYDNTERKKAKEDLLKAKERAEESDRLKSAFLANMSHEIRTPMNSIMGFASLLPGEKSKELIDRYTSIIVNNSEQLVHIIDGIVLYSQLQAKSMLLNNREFDLCNLLQDLKQSFSLPEYLKGVELFAEIITKCPQPIKSDYEKLRQVFMNLISNAFKYTKIGTITFGAEHKNNQILFFVKDTGIGIPVGETEKVFDRFFRGSNTRKESVPGTGLGLSIAKELIELLGGKIWVESIEGKGSTFWFTIPQP